MYCSNANSYQTFYNPFLKRIMMNEQQKRKISTFLSLVLRHKPAEIGLMLDDAGWVDVSLLLSQLTAYNKPVSMDQLQEIVETNDKQRFAFSEDGTRIRANQGHSVTVQLDYERAIPPELLYHGTVARFLPAIKEQGLKKMSRHHVHLSPDTATAEKVGQRRGNPMILSVRAAEMHEQGYAFYCTDNGVWLTDHVPAIFIGF